MQIVNVPIDSVFQDPKNARKHNKKNLDAIEESYKQFGSLEPLIVRKSNNIIIGGNGRHQVLKNLKKTNVDVLFVDVDDKTAVAMALALNKTGDLAEWNEDILSEFLQEYKDDFDFDALGFELDNYIKQEETKEKQNEKQYKSIFEIVIECENEVHQQSVYDLLVGEGYKCRVLSM